MANLTAVPGMDAVPQIELLTPLLGGPGGPLTRQAQALLNWACASLNATAVGEVVCSQPMHRGSR